jgi:hypothetical protein
MVKNTPTNIIRSHMSSTGKNQENITTTVGDTSNSRSRISKKWVQCIYIPVEYDTPDVHYVEYQDVPSDIFIKSEHVADTMFYVHTEMGISVDVMEKLYNSKQKPKLHENVVCTIIVREIY